MPAPLIFSFPVETAIVNALAPALKAMLFTVAPEVVIPVVFETSKVAISDGPFGTVAGVQLAAVLQALVAGFRFQVALPARAD